MAQKTVSGSMLQGGGNLSFYQPASTLSVSQPAATAQIMQPAATTQQLQPAGRTPSQNLSFAQPTPTPVQQPAGPTPEQIAAQQQAAQINNLKKGISNLIGESLNIYSSLYGGLGEAFSGKKKQLEEQYGREEQSMQQEFTQELPRIGTAYAGRGAYDSSWRINAEQAAGDRFKSQLDTLGAERRDTMAALGKSFKEQETQLKVGEEAINRLMADLASTTDLDKLTTIQNEITKRISDLKATSASLQSPETYMAAYQGIGGPTSRAGQVKATVDNILAGQAPAQLKQSVAAGFIQSSGLSPEEQDVLIQYVNTSIDNIATPTTPTNTIA